MQFKKLLFFILFLLTASTAYGATTSVPNVFVENDQFGSDFDSRLNANFNAMLTGGINNVESANIANDSLMEVDFADEINPRIRTAENACNGLVIDLLPVTSASLTTDTAAGTAYPYGYRIRKNSATSHSYTADTWTWVFLDIVGDFTYDEGAIGSAVPATPANSIPIARVSTDSTTVVDVQDLRLTECASLIMDRITHTPYEPTLHDIIKNGIPVTSAIATKSGTPGWIQGLGLRYTTGRTFTVKSGSAWINNQYRRISSDTVVPEQLHNPVVGQSGICAGANWSASTTYNVYAVADEGSQKDFSITACPSASGCSGCTNYRLIGSLKTSADTNIVSSDIVNPYSFDKREIVSAWVNFNGAAATITPRSSYNVSSIVDNGTGDYTINFTNGFADANYITVGNTGNHTMFPATDPGPNQITWFEQKTPTSVRVSFTTDAGATQDTAELNFLAVGGN